MIVPNQIISIKVTSSNRDHYMNLGYKCKIKDILEVSAE